MLTEAIKERLRDPEYLDAHLIAVAALAEVGDVKWYDSIFLRRFEAAKLFLDKVRPDALEPFEKAFAKAAPPVDFQPPIIDNLFDEETRDRLRRLTKERPEEEQNSYETEGFGRLVVHNHPFMVDLHEQLVPLVSKLVGRPVVANYSFLSLYGGAGQCDVHMDQPQAMFTLDYCIEQSEGWPIYFSKPVEWPTKADMDTWSPEQLVDDASLGWTPFVLQENQSLLFCGSSQWHHRKPIKPGGFCNLLFFHFYPEDCEDLVWPHLWAERLGIPELQPVCDLFTHVAVDGLN